MRGARKESANKMDAEREVGAVCRIMLVLNRKRTVTAMGNNSFVLVRVAMTCDVSVPLLQRKANDQSVMQHPLKKQCAKSLQHQVAEMNFRVGLEGTVVLAERQFFDSIPQASILMT